MPKYQKYKKTMRRGHIYNIIANPKASKYSRDKIDTLVEEIISSGNRYFLSEPDTPDKCTDLMKKIIRKKPYGVIACGGDGTVNIVGRALIRRKIGLGIYPLGKFNNIYRSLYGEPDLIESRQHILSKFTKKIDHGMASDRFFLGSLAMGLIPEIHELLTNGKNPHFAIGWSRLAAQAAAASELKPISLKVDAFGFELSPQTVNISLLPYCIGLRFSPASIADDGKCEITFDVGKKKTIMSNYIRNIYKQKYIYSNEIRMFRGQRISLFDISGRKFYLDGEITKFDSPELNIETFSNRIRLLYKL